MAGKCQAAASKHGETILAALERELREEGNIELSEPPILHAVYYKKRISRRDHVAFFIVRQFRQIHATETKLRDNCARVFRDRRFTDRHNTWDFASASPKC